MITDYTGILYLLWAVGKSLLPICGLFLIYHWWYECAERGEHEGIVFGILCMIPLCLPANLITLPDEYYARKAAARARHSTGHVRTSTLAEIRARNAKPEVVHVHHYPKAKPQPTPTRIYSSPSSSSSRSDEIDLHPTRRIRGSDRSSGSEWKAVMNMESGKFDMVHRDGYSYPQQ